VLTSGGRGRAAGGVAVERDDRGRVVLEGDLGDPAGVNDGERGSACGDG
jgi:hypothetical protein